jgi:hypothetical protein
VAHGTRSSLACVAEGAPLVCLQWHLVATAGNGQDVRAARHDARGAGKQGQALAGDGRQAADEWARVAQQP